MDPAFSGMLARMKLSTHQYARSQLKWIRKQLLPAVREARALGGEVAVYVVHGGEKGEGVARNVLDRRLLPSVWVIIAPLSDPPGFLRGEPLPDPRGIGHPDAAELLAILEDADRIKVPDTAE
jgi:tRNA dimethylallyltransferase